MVRVYKPEGGDKFHAQRRSIVDKKLKVNDKIYFEGKHGNFTTIGNDNPFGVVVEIPSFKTRLKIAIKNFIKEIKNPTIVIEIVNS